MALASGPKLGLAPGPGIANILLQLAWFLAPRLCILVSARYAVAGTHPCIRFR